MGVAPGQDIAAALCCFKGCATVRDTRPTCRTYRCACSPPNRNTGGCAERARTKSSNRRRCEIEHRKAVDVRQ